MSETQIANTSNNGTSNNGAPAPARWRQAPNIDVYESGEQYLVQLDVPGVDASSIDVQVVGTTLRIRAEQTKPSFESDSPTVLFERQLELPEEVEPDSASAEFKNGVLEIRITKGRTARRLKIPVASN
jgi:HSP20 family protein